MTPDLPVLIQSKGLDFYFFFVGNFYFKKNASKIKQDKSILKYKFRQCLSEPQGRRVGK